MFDYSKLRGRIREIMGSEVKFAEAMSLSSNSISLRFSGKVRWTNDDIVTACKILDIPLNDIPVYFFAEKVEKFIPECEGENNNE